MDDLVSKSKLIDDIEVLKKQIHKLITDINYITPTQCESVDMISRICECIMMELSAFEKAYKNIPTAYDLDKVVEQLIDNSRIMTDSPEAFAESVRCCENPKAEYVRNVVKLYEAIDIVKVGGIDE